MTAEPRQLAEHLFRREAGRMVARLARALGPAHLGLAEEAVQESLLEALSRWPFAGIPDAPAGWLFQVARNRAIDALRRRTRFEALEPAVIADLEARLEELPEPGFATEIDDDRLRLVFACCHPALPPEAQVALTLKTVCGFSVDEIARAFLSRPATIAQRITRAKLKIRELALPFAFPAPKELAERLQAVHRVLYLLFNEGYSPGAGAAVIRGDVCTEAVRLAQVLASHPVTGSPASHALAALVLLQGARLPARADASGEMLLLAEQDRTRWNREWLERGFDHLRRAMAATELTPLHLEAGIAACHAAAPSYAETDWRTILGYYDQLTEIAPSPVLALGRAVAVAEVHGPAAGAAACDALATEPALADYALLHAVRGDLASRLGHLDLAGTWFRRAASLSESEPVQRFLERRLAEVTSKGSPCASS